MVIFRRWSGDARLKRVRARNESLLPAASASRREAPGDHPLGRAVTRTTGPEAASARLEPASRSASTASSTWHRSASPPAGHRTAGPTARRGRRVRVNEVPLVVVRAALIDADRRFLALARNPENPATAHLGGDAGLRGLDLRLGLRCDAAAEAAAAAPGTRRARLARQVRSDEQRL